MHPSIQLPTAINPTSRAPLRLAFLLIPLAIALASLALSPAARAVCQDGCGLSLDNTFLGNEALNTNTSGFSNTAIGPFALELHTSDSDNTATGFQPLSVNTTGLHHAAAGAAAP